jgi:RHS repeat-associated protein
MLPCCRVQVVQSNRRRPVRKVHSDPVFHTPHRQAEVASGRFVQRYYDPGIGRFLSTDPVTAYEKPMTNFNRYVYALNNPYRFTDPDGREFESINPANNQKLEVTSTLRPQANSNSTTATSLKEWVMETDLGRRPTMTLLYKALLRIKQRSLPFSPLSATLMLRIAETG